jgi:dephospho-CoA kinase
MNRIIGLTGGIGSGKSTVAAMLAARGAIVIDADRVAHEVYAPGTEGFDKVVARFGEEVLDGDGVIDRKALGAVVFGDPEALAELNAIIHPLVRKEVARRLLEAAQRRPEATIVIEAALMTETGWTGGAGALWVVLAEPEVALQRLVRDRGMSEAEARLRIGAQATNEARRKHATIVIENNGTLEELESAVDQAWRTLSTSS